MRRIFESMPYKWRKRLSLVVLLVVMPIYIVIVLNLLTSIERLPFWAEVLAYVTLGVIWIFPFKWVFMGVGQPEQPANSPPGPQGRNQG